MICKPKIYKPKGAAGEYAKYAINVALECSNGCRYCYVPQTLRKSRADFVKEPKAREGIVEAVARQSEKMRLGFGDEVFMSFTCDPFAKSLCETTGKIISVLCEKDCLVRTLTKSPRNALENCLEVLDFFAQQILFGVTLTFFDEAKSRETEPNADSPQERVDAMWELRQKGISCWASVEPVIDCGESLKIIEAALPCCDEFRIGKINHCKEFERGQDWAAFCRDAKKLIEGAGKKCVFKESLKKWAGE